MMLKLFLGLLSSNHCNISFWCIRLPRYFRNYEETISSFTYLVLKFHCTCIAVGIKKKADI